MTSPLKLIFMGTPSFCLPTLETLKNSPHSIIAVYTQPPRPSGRGHRIQRSSVHDWANAHEIPVFTPLTLKNDEEAALFAGHGADVGIVIAYGLILPEKILQGPRLGCLNVHASLLPRWRGAAPIARSIEAGDAETGITIMKMDAGLDTGPIFQKQGVPITPDSTTASLQETLAHTGADLLLDTVNAYAAGKLEPLPQAECGITYAHKLGREESRIDWNLPASAIACKIRAFSPWPGTWFMHKGVQLKIIKAEVELGITDKPGMIMDAHLTIACGKDALRILQLQRPGGKVLEAWSFLKGHPLCAGERLPCLATS
jgi:methionyl-tRNA formyltransferase